MEYIPKLPLRLLHTKFDIVANDQINAITNCLIEGERREDLRES